MMNTVKSPTLLHSANQARVSGGEMTALDMLGQQLIQNPELLKQNPEIAKLLENAPEGVTFDQLLAQMNNGEVAAEKAVDPKLLAQMVKNNLDAKASEIGETNPQKLDNQQINNPLYKLENQGQQDSKSILVKPQTLASDQLAVAKNAEDASRAFVPERKSIFAVKKQNSDVATQGAISKKAAQAKAQNGLMDFNTFMSKQSATTKANMAKASANNAYKSGVSESMFAKKVEATAPGLTNSVDQTTMKVTDLMLASDGSQSDQSMDFSGQQSLQKAPSLSTQMQSQKVFDMSQLNMNQDVINQIQDYIIQAKASSEPTVQMSFQHNDLGVVDLVVQKAHGDQVSILINTHSMEGSKFFTQNQTELLQTLTQSGVNVSEFKLDSSNNTNNNGQDNFGQNSRNSQNQHASDDRQQRNEDSQRRQELWDLLNNKEAA